VSSNESVMHVVSKDNQIVNNVLCEEPEVHNKSGAPIVQSVIADVDEIV